VWVEAGGVCQNGHGADCVSEAHEATRGRGMKCPVCESIVDSIDPCPICVRDARKAARKLGVKHKGAGWVLPAGLILAVTGGVVFLLLGVIGATQGTLPTAAQAPVALNAAQVESQAHAALRASLTADQKTMDSYVSSIAVQDDGAVIITLNQTSAQVAPTSGANGAEEIGAAFNAIVLRDVPDATSVATFDADNTMLELSTRE